MHEFEEFLSRLLSGTIRETELRIDGGPVRLGELRGGEERRVQVEVGECGYVCVAYSYVEGDIEGCVRAGEAVVGVGDKVERIDRGSGDEGGGCDPRRSSGGPKRWDYVDPLMARRWAKHLHGYRT
ncbi:hypothetical protein QJS10_CPB15g01230 [Acorus calamus]|uniref:Uncharacterized protein n=1 Tax=Acorus calamus TaxID=4465 RepID=A0AAV9D962_ACOCL|nr:hypothetical protein QJS10_CPB15g01230 [Acorus calamus]